jgi:outer membrane protein W
MKRLLVLVSFCLQLSVLLVAQEKQEQKDESSPNLRQYVSGKFGFYSPSGGLNNGLLLGLDGITEFIRHDIFLSGAIDFYPKQTIDIFQNPKPDVAQQSIVILPLHVNIGYKFFDASSAESRAYVGAGGGYYFYFYNVDYHTSSGGLLGSSVTTQSDSKSGGGVFATAFGRALIGKIFVEPRVYLASKKSEKIGDYAYEIDPSGFAITLGFQYH